MTPRLTAKVKLEDYTLIEQLRTRERGSFFNLGEVKYLPVEGVIYSVRVLKCMVLLTGDNDQRRENTFGKLVSETQVELKAAEGALINLQKTTSNEANIFRPDFTI